MPITDDLLNEVSGALGAAIQPSLSSSSNASDLFEAYVFTLVLRAAIIEGAKVSYFDPWEKPTSNFVFRTSPGYLWSTAKPYTHARIALPSKELLEAHLGVRVTGKSGVLHEFDVCVLYHSEAQTSRANQVHPRSSRVLFGIECKFYTSSLDLALARAFIGLGTDVTARDTFFVTNTASASVEKLLTARNRKWANRAFPASRVDVERLRGEFQSAFKYFKAL